MNLRKKLQVWLGIDCLPSVEMYKAMELAQKHRHAELCGKIEELSIQLRNAHAFERPQEQFSAPTLDWNTVEMLAMRELEQNPPKES